MSGIDKKCLCDEEVFVRFGGFEDSLAFKLRRMIGSKVTLQECSIESSSIEGEIISIGTEMIHFDIGLYIMTLPFSAVKKIVRNGEKIIYDDEQEEHVEKKMKEKQIKS